MSFPVNSKQMPHGILMFNRCWDSHPTLPPFEIASKQKILPPRNLNYSHKSSFQFQPLNKQQVQEKRNFFFNFKNFFLISLPSPKNIVFACKLHQFKVRFELSLDISGGVEKRSGIVLLLSYLQRKELLSYLQGKEGTFSFPTLSVPTWLLFRFNTQNQNIICKNTPRSCTLCQRRQGCILHIPRAPAHPCPRWCYILHNPAHSIPASCINYIGIWIHELCVVSYMWPCLDAW